MSFCAVVFGEEPGEGCVDYLAGISRARKMAARPVRLGSEEEGRETEGADLNRKQTGIQSAGEPLVCHFFLLSNWDARFFGLDLLVDNRDFSTVVSAQLHQPIDFLIVLFDEFREEADPGRGITGKRPEHGGEDAKEVFGGLGVELLGVSCGDCVGGVSGRDALFMNIVNTTFNPAASTSFSQHAAPSGPAKA